MNCIRVSAVPAQYVPIPWFPFPSHAGLAQDGHIRQPFFGSSSFLFFPPLFLFPTYHSFSSPRSPLRTKEHSPSKIRQAGETSTNGKLPRVESLCVCSYKASRVYAFVYMFTHQKPWGPFLPSHQNPYLAMSVSISVCMSRWFYIACPEEGKARNQKKKPASGPSSVA